MSLNVHDLSQISNKLSQDLMWYCKNVEETLTSENLRLAADLRDAQLDLEDSRRSRRQLQQQLDIAEKSLSRYESDHDALKVAWPAWTEIIFCSMLTM